MQYHIPEEEGVLNHTAMKTSRFAYLFPTLQLVEPLRYKLDGCWFDS
jgi:hypothetical protein